MGRRHYPSWRTTRGRGGRAARRRAVESELSDILRTVRAEMLALPCRCGAWLPHLSTHDIAEIDAEIRAVLAEVAGS